MIKLRLGIGGLAVLAAFGALPANAVAAPPAPITLAFGQPIARLQASADAGDPLSQYALAILYSRGLRGLAVDEDKAIALRARARVSRGSQSITTYTAGLNGAPGRVGIINLPQGGVPSAMSIAAEACLKGLAQYADDDAILFPLTEAGRTFERRSARARRGCGIDDAEAFRDLVTAFADARPRRAQTLPACPQKDEGCADLSAKVARLNARDPVAEAASAVAAGDFHLGGFNHFGHFGDQIAGWRIPAVECAAWSYTILGKRHVNDDDVEPGDREHSAAAVAFLAAYNRRVVDDPAFPYADLCALDLAKPAGVSTGRTLTAGQAARSRDPALLAQIPATTDWNSVDLFDKRPLDWAVRNKDMVMVVALARAGADPNQYDREAPAPLALAIDVGDRLATAALLERGARMRRMTGLCQEPVGVQYIFPDEPLKPDDPRCTWSGLLLARGRLDLIEQQASAGALTARQLPRRSDPEGFDGLFDQGQLKIAFIAAVKTGDKELARRLAPLVRQRIDDPVEFLGELVRLGEPEFVRSYVLADGSAAARSPAEARLWRAAAQGGHDAALSYLYEAGADLNLLSSDALKACEDHAARGAIDPLKACVAQAAQVRVGLDAALAAGDAAAFNALTAQVTDVAERNKTSLVQQVADAGTVEMLRPLLARGASPNQQQPRMAYISSATGLMPTPQAPNPWPVSRALERGDTQMLRLLVDAGADALPGLLSNLGDLGSGRSPAGTDLVAQDEDTSTWPDGPAPDKMKSMELVAAEIVRRDGPQALERALSGAVYNGYDDVLRLMLRHGFSASTVADPATIWQAWSGLGQACKPSTGRLLLRMGLPTRYPSTEFSSWTPLQQVAAACRNPRSVAVLLEEAKLDVNQLNIHGQTALDVASAPHRAVMRATLRAAGGRTASELGAPITKDAETSDPDLASNS